MHTELTEKGEDTETYRQLLPVVVVVNAAPLAPPRPWSSLRSCPCVSCPFVVPARLMQEDAVAPTAVLRALHPLCALSEHALPTPTMTQTPTPTPTPTAMSQSRALLALTLAATVLASSGCFLVAAGAGAGAAVAYNNRGATAQLPGGVNATFDKAVASFGRNGISETGRGTENSGTLRTLTGTKGDLEVTVEMKRKSDNVTAVEVVAKKNLVEYDRDFAKQVLEEMAK